MKECVYGYVLDVETEVFFDQQAKIYPVLTRDGLGYSIADGDFLDSVTSQSDRDEYSYNYSVFHLKPNVSGEALGSPRRPDPVVFE